MFLTIQDRLRLLNTKIIQKVFEVILFIDSYPWQDKKYVKRLYRLFYLIVVDLFTNVKSKSKRIKIIKLLSKSSSK